MNESVGAPIRSGTRPDVAGGTAGMITIAGSVMERAKRNDRDALDTMFGQFIEPSEQIVFVEYMGYKGLWLFGHHSFACLTGKRVASMQVGGFGEVVYQDGFLEELNSGVIYQPSVLLLYVIAIVLTVVTFGVGVLLLPLVVKAFYRWKKCGIVLWVREGVPIYIFSDRKRLTRVNELYRHAMDVRDERLLYIKKY